MFRRSDSSSGRGRQVPALVAVAGVVAALVLGIVIGGAGGEGSGPAPTPVPAATGPGPAQVDNGIPSGFAHSRAGAAAAVAAYERAFAGPAVLAPGALRERIEAVAAPDYVGTMLAANEPGGERIANGAIGAGLGEGVSTVFVAVPVGYRVQDYTGTRARLLTWGFTLLGNAATVEPGAYFGTTETELIWQSGDWKIAGTTASFGPTPKLVTPRQGLEGFGLLHLAKGLTDYAVAP
jgi:hypothetical protein